MRSLRRAGLKNGQDLEVKASSEIVAIVPRLSPDELQDERETRTRQGRKRSVASQGRWPPKKAACGQNWPPHKRWTRLSWPIIAPKNAEGRGDSPRYGNQQQSDQDTAVQTQVR